MFNKLFKRRSKEIDWKKIDLILSDDEKVLIKRFIDKPSDSRIQDSMILGDSGDFKIFKILQYAILYDPDLNVKFASLKRIHNFKEHTDLIPMLTKIQQDKLGNKMEPYFSMALSRIGLITIEEFNNKINTVANN